MSGNVLASIRCAAKIYLSPNTKFIFLKMLNVFVSNPPLCRLLILQVAVSQYGKNVWKKLGQYKMCSKATAYLGKYILRFRQIDDIKLDKYIWQIKTNTFSNFAVS